MTVAERAQWNLFFSKIDSAIQGKEKFTLVLEDPFAASYVQSFANDGPDSQITVENYERTAEEEEDLGLDHINIDNYNGDETEEQTNGDKTDER